MAYQSTIAIVSILAILVLALPRRYFLLPFILGAFFIPSDQRIVIFTLDFTAIRILVLVGLIKTVATVNQGLCQGCGLCVATCCSKSIDLDGYTEEQLFAEIGAF